MLVHAPKPPEAESRRRARGPHLRRASATDVVNRSAPQHGWPRLVSSVPTGLPARTPAWSKDGEIFLGPVGAALDATAPGGVETPLDTTQASVGWLAEPDTFPKRQ